MLQPALVNYADSIDEKNYRVTFHEHIQYEANKQFDDGDYYSIPWFADIWRSGFRQKMATAGISIGKSDLVLDICCGQGYLGEMIARESQARVICCDLSQPQLHRLRSRVNGSGAIFPCITDVLHVQFRAQSFDLVLGNSFLHHLADVPAALNELRQLIRPGGYLVVFHEPSITSTFWESFPLSLLKDTSSRGGNFTDLWMFEPHDLLDLSRSAGFQSASVLGGGILGSIFVNWYLILGMKLHWESRSMVYPAYVLRNWLNYIELGSIGRRKWNRSPSLMLIAQA